MSCHKLTQRAIGRLCARLKKDPVRWVRTSSSFWKSWPLWLFAKIAQSEHTAAEHVLQKYEKGSPCSPQDCCFCESSCVRSLSSSSYVSSTNGLRPSQTRATQSQPHARQCEWTPSDSPIRELRLRQRLATVRALSSCVKPSVHAVLADDLHTTAQQLGVHGPVEADQTLEELLVRRLLHRPATPLNTLQKGLKQGDHTCHFSVTAAPCTVFSPPSAAPPEPHHDRPSLNFWSRSVGPENSLRNTEM